MPKLLSRSWVLGRRELSTVFAVITALVIGTIEPAAAQSDAKLIYALETDSRSLWASFSTNQPEINISVQITEKLIEFTPDGQGFEPRLATSWEEVDSTTLRLKLREGVTFTNGEPFNAESAKFSLELLLSVPAYKTFTRAFTGEAEEAVKIIDPQTVEITSTASTASTLFTLAMGSFQYPKAYFEEVGKDEFGLKPIGTGPYKLVRWDKGVKIVLEANPDYWGPQSTFKEVDFQIIPDTAAQVAALQSGQVHFVPTISLGAIDRIKRSESATIVSRPGIRLYMMNFNTIDDGPLKDPAVRKALYHAIDQKALISAALNGHGFPLNNQNLTPTHFGFNPEIPFPEYNPEKAKELLAAAGYPDGFTMNLQYSPKDFVEIGQVVASQLQSVGVTVEHTVQESGTFLTALSTDRAKDAFYWGALYPPDAGFVWGSSVYAIGGKYMHYSNEEFSHLWKQQLTATTAEDRLKIFGEIYKVFEKDPPFLPLLHAEDAYGISKSISGFVPRASQYVDLRTFKN